MLKKYMYVIVVSMIVFLNVITCRAYNYVNSNNKNEIEDIIQGIFDSKELYEELAGKKTGSEPTLYDASNNSYWWPIGSVETVEIDGVLFANGEPESTHITSYFGYRDPIYRNGVQISGGKAHGALDIANSRGPNTTNIIAARDGVVVYPNNVSQTKCVDGGDINCGGKYGNYIIIQHSDGNYTLYGHLAKDSVFCGAKRKTRTSHCKNGNNRKLYRNPLTL